MNQKCSFYRWKGCCQTLILDVCWTRTSNTNKYYPPGGGWADPWCKCQTGPTRVRKRSKPRASNSLQKLINLQGFQIGTVPEVKPIRTGLHFDLSQKAEKRCHMLAMSFTSLHRLAIFQRDLTWRESSREEESIDWMFMHAIMRSITPYSQ